MVVTLGDDDWAGGPAGFPGITLGLAVALFEERGAAEVPLSSSEFESDSESVVDNGDEATIGGPWYGGVGEGSGVVPSRGRRSLPWSCILLPTRAQIIPPLAPVGAGESESLLEDAWLFESPRCRLESGTAGFCSGDADANS